jgi:hypothetical protein
MAFVQRQAHLQFHSARIKPPPALFALWESTAGVKAVLKPFTGANGHDHDPDVIHSRGAHDIELCMGARQAINRAGADDAICERRRWRFRHIGNESRLDFWLGAQDVES